MYSIFKRIQKHSLKITSRLVISNINIQWKFQIAPIDSIWIANKKKKKNRFHRNSLFPFSFSRITFQQKKISKNDFLNGPTISNFLPETTLLKIRAFLLLQILCIISKTNNTHDCKTNKTYYLYVLIFFFTFKRAILKVHQSHWTCL